MSAVCAREGCSKPLPQVALREGDPYCSARCCRIEHGLEEDLGERDYRHARNRCKGCGVATSESEFTPGCKPCATRRAYRVAKGLLAA